MAARAEFPSQREIDGVIAEQAMELIRMHNDDYHPGRDCPGEDEDGACHLRSGKPAVLTWGPNGPICADAGLDSKEDA